MSRASEHEQAVRIQDLEDAMKAIGRVLADESIPLKRRLDMTLGILWRYDATQGKPS